jgi:UPF0755 protein
MTLRGRASWLGAITVLGLALIGSGVLVRHGLRPGPALADTAGIVDVPAHAGVLAIAHRLKEVGVIRSKTAFVGLSLLRGSARRLQAGEYEVPAGSSTLQVLALLESGRVRQHMILHPEGGTLQELARVLEAEGLAGTTEVMQKARDSRVLAALGVAAPSLEGYLFPDTYRFTRGMTSEEMLGRMVQHLRAKLSPELQLRAQARGLSLNELLTLASIVEREAIAPEERPLIAAVFWNRLRRGMPLQADPTVQYAVGKERRALTRADLQADDPYNTYRRAGLPPGPIASPGLAAIEAILDPAPVAYLYFVAMDDRRHHFSTTIREHNAAVARYRLLRLRAEDRGQLLGNNGAGR